MSNQTREEVIAELDRALSATFQVIRSQKADIQLLRETLDSIWYSEFGNSETCMEGEQIKKALAATAPGRKVGV